MVQTEMKFAVYAEAKSHTRLKEESTSHKEPVGLNGRVVLDHTACTEFLEEYGHPNTIAAFRKSQFNVDPNTSIEFWWGDAETLEERARCIRGAFRRISEEARKDGRCSNHFTATFRVVSE